MRRFYYAIYIGVRQSSIELSPVISVLKNIGTPSHDKSNENTETLRVLEYSTNPSKMKCY